MTAMLIDAPTVVVVKESIWTRIKRNVGAFFTSLGRGIKSAWSWTKAHAQSAWSWTTAHAASAWIWTKAAASSIWTWTTSFVRSAARSVVMAAPVAWNTTVDAVTWLVRATLALLGTALNWILATVLFGMVIEGLSRLRNWIRNSAARRDARAARRIARRQRHQAVASTEPVIVFDDDVSEENRALIKAEVAHDHAVVNESLARQEAALTDEGGDIYSNEVMAEMTKFVALEDSIRTDFDFTPYKNHADVLLVLEWMRDMTSGNPAEQSYWAGRYEALSRYLRDKNLDKAPQWRSLVVHQAKSRQADYRLPEVKTGFDAMVAELKAQKSTARATARRS